MNGKSEITEKYLGLYKDNIKKISGISSPFFNSFRAPAFEKFSELESLQRRMKLINIPI